MFLKVAPPNLDLKDPWKDDAFKRSEFANPLCSLLKATSHSAVIGISAPYGFGKTFFLQRLREQIKGEDGWVIYVNAWEYDYLDSALLALLDALKVAAFELSDKSTISKAISDIGKAAAPALIKAASKRVIESVVGPEGSRDVIEAVAEASGKSAENLVNRFIKEDSTNKTLDVLRNKISEFVDGHINEKSTYKTLIVIVDELDRARPSFCIRFLETIKHLFSLSQVVFIIGCDRAVLVSSALHEYGTGLPVDGYLRRLFDYWIDLPPPRPQDYVYQCAGRLNLLTDRIFTQDQTIEDGIEEYADFLLLGKGDEDASLRFIEQSVAHAGVVLKLASADRQAGLIGWLQGLKQFSPTLYDEYVSNQNLSDILPTLQKYKPFAEAKPFQKAWIVIWAANSKSPLTEPEVRAYFGAPNELYSMINRIVSDRYFSFDDRESIAHRIDKRLRMISLYLR